MHKDVVRYVQSCYICQHCKPLQTKPAGTMEKRQISKPWQIVGSDCIGPYPRSKLGYTHVVIFDVVIFDLFTKWIEAVPLRKKNALSIAISDEGTEFCNKIMTDLAREKDFTHVKLPPGHPQADPVEKVNRIFKAIINSYITPDHRTWGDDLNEKAWCYNISIHNTTGFSPFYLCNGRHSVTSPSLRRNKEHQAAQEWEKRLKELEMVRQVASDNQKESTETHAKYYNQHRSSHDFKIGDVVLVKNVVLSNATEHISAGFTPKFHGDYTIVSKVSNNIFVLADADGYLLGEYHVKDIKHRVSRDQNKLSDTNDQVTHLEQYNNIPHQESSFKENSTCREKEPTISSDLETYKDREMSPVLTHTRTIYSSNQPEGSTMETVQKKGPGRPKKNKRGSRKTILAPQTDARQKTQTRSTSLSHSVNTNESGGMVNREISPRCSIRVTRSRNKANKLT